MKAKIPISKLNRRRFDGDWDHIDYCYHKILYWFYSRRNRSKALKFCQRLAPILQRADRNHDAIKTEECWSLIFEVRGDLGKAISYRKSEIRLIRKLQRIKPIVEYFPGDLADRLILLGILYDDAGETKKALQTLQEAKRICARARVQFDSEKLLKGLKTKLGKPPQRERLAQ